MDDQNPRRAEAKKQQTAGQQWVKSPVAGLVTDIRLVEVAVDGVTLEILIERRETANQQASAPR